MADLATGETGENPCRNGRSRNVTAADETHVTDWLRATHDLASRAKPSERPEIGERHATLPLRERLLDAVVGVFLALLTCLAYILAAGPSVFQQSNQPHFVLLADALLHGHLWIDPARAVRLGDVTPFAGRFYVSFPPMPAILMLPFVAVAGPGFDDRLFSIALGSIDVALTYLLARRLSAPGYGRPGVPLGRLEAIAVATLLGFGTVHFYAALAGTVWFIAHVVSVTFALLYLIECAGACRPFVAGAALALAFLARTPLIFGLVFWAALALQRTGPPSTIIPRAIRFSIPLAAAIALLLGQNVIRFGSPLDFGYLSMRIARQLQPDLQQYGQFSPHFLARNLAALLVTPPIVAPIDPSTWLQTIGGVTGLPRLLQTPTSRLGAPFPITFDPWGTGLWAVSPALIFSLRPPRRQDLALAGTAWLSAFLVAAPDLLYYNTGWVQYGDRFSLDFTPFLLVLTAMGLRRSLCAGWRILFVALLIVSIASNVLGARWFLHLPPY